MQKLSSTWKQQKQTRTRQEKLPSLKPTLTSTRTKTDAVALQQNNTKTTKRLGKHAVSVSASSSKLIGRANQMTTNQDEDRIERSSTTGRNVPLAERIFRRSPRLKSQEVQAVAPLITVKEPLTHREDGCSSFSSSFTGDLDDDVLRAMEEAEANYCHQNQQTTRDAGAPLQGILITDTTSKCIPMETSENTGSWHSAANACDVVAKRLATSSNTGAFLKEFQNSEDLFTELKPTNVEVEELATTLTVNSPSTNSVKMNSASMNSAKIDCSKTDRLCNELKIQSKPKYHEQKRANSSAILSELTRSNEKRNGTNVSEHGRKFMDSFENVEKENTPAGQVYCMDSQSQNETSPLGRDRPKQFVGRDKIIHKEQNRMIDKRKSEKVSGINRQCIPASENSKENIARTSAEVTPPRQDFAINRVISSPTTSTATQTQPTSDPLLISSWGLPEQVLAQYHRCHITRMFPWQAQCLAHGRVLDGGNLVYSAPTSAGKTLVAELLILKRILETKKKALLILPFVSVAREKMFYLQSMFQDAGISVGGYMGSESPTGGFKCVDVAVCTIEKANGLVNRLLEEDKVDQLGIIVVDELHMVGDAHRGYLLELLLTKIRYITKKVQGAVKTTLGKEDSANIEAPKSIQIVGMSATLPNLDHLAKWLDADLYHTDFRPVPLTQTLKVGRTIYDASLVKLREVKPPQTIQGDEDQIVSLCLETLSIGCSVLIFCPTKNWCEKLCQTIAREIAKVADDRASVKLDGQSLQDVLEQLKRTPVGLDAVLRRTIPCGVAYHHAGLSFDERDIVEGAFRQSSVKILVATSTLSSGVNLPARRVIIRSVMFNRKVLDPLVYRQMSGRAGRKGVDTEGESILICKPNEREKAATLMQADLPPVQSCLKKPGQDLSNSMKRAILEVIASGAASTPEEVSRYASCTLLAASMSSDQDLADNPPTGTRSDPSTAIHKCVQFLKEQEFIILQKVKVGDEIQERFRPSQLGSATLASALSPDEALVVFSELQRARKNFVLENDLHLLYQVTPIYDQGFQPDWYEFMCTWENLSTDKRRVAELVGVEERFLIRAAQGGLSTHNARLQHALAIHKRFYTTLILNDLIGEMPVVAAARKYSCARGQLQSLQQSAATFAGMVTAFCSKLGWTNLELLLAQYQSRLTFGIQRELCDLVRISLLNAFRARLLYSSGFASVAAVASAKPSDIEGVLRKAVPFQSSRKAIDEQQYEVEERKQSRCIWATGRKGLTEQQAALMIVQEAQHLLQADVGALGVEWKPKEEGPASKSEAGVERPSSSRIQPPDTDSPELPSAPRSENDNNESRCVTSPPSRIHLPNMKCDKSILKKSATGHTEEKQKLTEFTGESKCGKNCSQGSSIKPVGVKKKNCESESANSSKTASSEKGSSGDGIELAPVTSDVQISIGGGSCEHTRGRGLGRTLTVEADVHIDASLSGRASDPNISLRSKPEASLKIAPQVSTRPSAHTAKSNSNWDSAIHVSSTPSQQSMAEVREMPRNKVTFESKKMSALGSAAKEPQQKHLVTPDASANKPPGAQEITPELFSVPVSPDEGTEAATTGHETNAPVTNQLSPKDLAPDSPAFSPIDSQILQFVEQQDPAECPGKSSTQNVLNQVSPPVDLSRSRQEESQAFSVFSPLDPEVLRLMDGLQEVDSKKEQQEVPAEERDAIPVPSSPSYSPLDSQALFNDSTASELHLSQGHDSQFMSSFLALDSQALKLIDEFHSKRNDLAATSASPSLGHSNRSQMSGKQGTTKTPQRTSRRRSSLKGKSSSSKKQKLVLTFCQSESPYSEFLQDDEITFDLAKTSQCSFVIDQAEPEITPRSSTKKQSGKRKAGYRGSKRKSSSTMNAVPTPITNSDKEEAPVYSQLEADLALAAEWSDSFSFDEGEQVVAKPPPKSTHVQDHHVNLSESLEKEKDDPKPLSNVNALPPKVLRSTTKSTNSAHTGKTEGSRKATSGDDLLLDSVDKHFNDQLSPGTLAMLDLFAGDSFSGTPSSVAKTESTSRPSQNVQGLKESVRGTRKTRTVDERRQTSATPATSDGRSLQPNVVHQIVRKDLGAKSDGIKSKQPKGEQRKRRSSEGISNLVQEQIPIKKVCHQQQLQAGSPPVLDDTPDARRRSDGDCISPTPPKDKPNTPKFLKGTPKQRPSREVLFQEDTPRSLRLRSRSQLKQSTKMQKAQPVRSSADNRRTPSKSNRVSPRSTPFTHHKLLASPLSTPQLDSPMQSQSDLNAAQGESQLHLYLDSESSFEVEPPTPPRSEPAPGKPSSNITPKRSSSKDDHSASLMQQASPRVSATQGTFTIIDVCSSKELFRTFLKEWRSKSRYSLSLACERYQPPVQGGGIGGNIRKVAQRPNKPESVDGFQVGDEALVVVGLSVCWEDKDAYFISFQKETTNVDPDDSLAQPPLDPGLPIQQRLQSVKTVLELGKIEGRHLTQQVCKLAFDCKEHYKVLSRGCGIKLNGSLVDPKVAHWLLDPCAKERNLPGLVTHYIPQEVSILEGISGGIGLGSLGLLGQATDSGRLRAATESVLVLALMENLEPVLKEDGLYKAFTEVEMPCIQVLARMELTGFGFSQNECESQKAVMQTKLASLEEQAYQMAGHTFSLTSPEDIAQVLYIELKLPPNGDPTLASSGGLRKTLGARGGTRPRLPKNFSTSKDSLEKLRSFHPLPGVVLEWRRITAAVTKVVFPLLKEKKPEPKLGGERIYPFCQTHTATGRVCLSDPNIQAIPRDFEIQMPSTVGESPPMGAAGLSYPTRSRMKHTQGRGQSSRAAGIPQEGCAAVPSCSVSVRHAFCPFPGGVLLAADYSQLELRILAHLSGDSKLADILNGGGDVFKCIAAQWRGIEEAQVTPKQRQQAKQICYGMVYGIGAKSLGQQLEESEEDAAAFMESFKTQYKGMKNYIRDTVASCRANGFVETLLRRRRFLPAITHTNPAARSQGERQAVNTTVQGSAADLVKVAMVNIDRRLKEEFPNTTVTHRHREDFETGLTSRRKSRRYTTATPSGAFLVLQLHDELIYEVHREDVIQVAQLVKLEMETAMKLTVRLPVKVKVGPTWGSLQDYDI